MTMREGTAMSKSRAGFTLVEIVVVIAVISILASMAVPFAAKMIDSAREESTRKRMLDIDKAILGDPATGTFGFVGDMGRLPNGANPVQQLGSGTGMPGTSNGQLGVRYGYNGPYINSGFSAASYYTDAWGRNFDYNFPNVGQIRSRGADGVAGTAPNFGDDIIYPPNQVNINGRLTVNVYVWDNTQFVPNPTLTTYPGTTGWVRVYFSNNGVQSAMPLSLSPTLAAPPFVFTVPAGAHAVLGSITLPAKPAATGQAVAAVPSNNQQTVLNLYLR
jgi:prepilin-type N-terminal cleavage/methylation domain-containing protein